jgi:hypothetical protein
MFTIGQKVVCIDDRFHPSIVEWGDQYPVCERVYTVRWVGVSRHGVTRELGLALRLEELRNPGDRLTFSAWRFRPQAETVHVSCAEEAAVGRSTQSLKGLAKGSQSATCSTPPGLGGD